MAYDARPHEWNYQTWNFVEKILKGKQSATMIWECQI